MISPSINSSGLLRKQIPHVQRLVDSLYLNNHATDLSETGCGKTFCAAAVARQLNIPFAVICPKSVIPAWKKTLHQFGIKPLFISNYELLIRGSRKSYYTSWKKETIYTKGGESKVDRLRFNKRIPENTLLIFDEIHRGKALDSSTSELVVTAREQNFKVLSLSASAATNPIEMKAFGFIHRLHDYREANDFKRHFATTYGAEWTGVFGTLMFDPEKKEAQEGMKAIHNSIFNKLKCASRLTTETMKEHFGTNHVSALALDCGNSEKINKVYDQMQYELDLLDDQTAHYSDHIFAIMMRARRHSELLKIPSFIEQVKNHIRDKKSIAVFLNFNESIDCLTTKLQKYFNTKKSIKENGVIQLCHVRGGQSTKERQKHIDNFQNDICRVMISNISAGGTGISLHDLIGKFPRVSLISPNYSAFQLVQALGRVFRAEAKSGCLQEIIFAAETIEENACARVQARLNNLSMLNSGDLTSGINFYNTNINWDK